MSIYLSIFIYMYIYIYSHVGANGQGHAPGGVQVPRGYIYIY